MIYELVIDDDEIDEVFSISLVKNPAMEANWIYFNKEKEIVKFATLDNEKRIIVAPVLIPNKQVLRVDGEGKNYYVFFKPETIEKLAQKYIAKGYQSNATLEHKDKINGSVTVVESWVSKDSVRDKSNIYFGNQYPEGTWFVSWKVNDSKLWDEYIKTGDVQGASIEGLFGHNLVSAAKEEIWMSKDVNELTNEEASLFLSMIKDLILEAQPSIASTYPGEEASGSIAPALLAAEGCPEATQNIAVNLKGRQNAIDTAHYGPLNPNEPNEPYWKAKADMFGSSIEEAKKALCGNCSFFVQTPQILDCIAAGINDTNEWDTIDAGDLGYCEAFDFKCAASRTCDAWVAGGPITK